MTEHVDLRSDLHGHVSDWVVDLDRKWFAEHPGELEYDREPAPHEWCNPSIAVTEQRCETPVHPHRRYLVHVSLVGGWRNIVTRALWRVDDVGVGIELLALVASSPGRAAS